jgi:hypothetical protein
MRFWVDKPAKIGRFSAKPRLVMLLPLFAVLVAEPLLSVAIYFPTRSSVGK